MYGVIDIGTNSVRLFVGSFVKGKLTTIHRDLVITRLGQGVDKSGKLASEAIERTVKALVGFKGQLVAYALDSFALMATSAVRDAANREQFIDQVRACTGWKVDILSGDEEAELSFLGAVKSLDETKLADTIWVIDIGGGSTEIIQGTPEGKVVAGGSAQVGAVRMTEAFISQHPIDQSELAVMEEIIYQRLAKIVPSPPAHPLLVAVGGTATTLAAIHLGLVSYWSEAISGTNLSQDQVERMYQGLAKMDLGQRAKIHGLQKGREDVIVAGAGILLTAMRHLGCPQLVVSDNDLLQGKIYQDSAKGS